MGDMRNTCILVVKGLGGRNYHCDWTAWIRVQLRNLVKTVMSPWVPYGAKNFRNSWATVSFNMKMHFTWDCASSPTFLRVTTIWPDRVRMNWFLVLALGSVLVEGIWFRLNEWNYSARWMKRTEFKAMLFKGSFI
jgi:hypothetical protein